MTKHPVRSAIVIGATVAVIGFAYAAIRQTGMGANQIAPWEYGLIGGLTTAVSVYLFGRNS